jgi:cell division protein FtsL
MSALAPSARASASGRGRGAAAKRRPVAGGVLWIVLLAALLAGVVAVNVVVLQLNVRLDGLSRQRTELRADNAKLRAQLSSAAANARIARDAQGRLGLQAADPSTTTYVRLAP